MENLKIAFMEKKSRQNVNLPFLVLTVLLSPGFLCFLYFLPLSRLENVLVTSTDLVTPPSPGNIASTGPVTAGQSVRARIHF